MKKLDIEKWERKNPKLPENFFDEMQKNVLAKTINKKEPKRFSLNWVWASAAAIALVFGLMRLYDTNDEVVKIEEHLVQNEVEKVQNNTLVVSRQGKKEDLNPDVEEKSVIKNTFVSQNKEIVPAKSVKDLETKVQVEEILNSMTENELEDLAMNYAQDVYFDLY